MGEFKEICAVHACLDESIYREASRGMVYLFYATVPMKRMDCRSQKDFAGEYYVYPSNALPLYELIKEGRKPEDIVSTLGLKKRSLRELIDVCAWEDDNQMKEYYKSAREYTRRYPYGQGGSDGLRDLRDWQQPTAAKIRLNDLGSDGGLHFDSAGKLIQD